MLRSRSLLLGAALLVVLSGPSPAQTPQDRLVPQKNLTAQDFANACRGEGPSYAFAKSQGQAAALFSNFDKVMCRAYISGIVAMNKIGRRQVGAAPFCIPGESADIKELTELYLGWTAKNQARLQDHQAETIVDAFQEAFPCAD